MARAAIFLDRDGTIIEDVGILNDPAGIRLFDDTIRALRLMHGKYLLFVVTNQNGVAKGLVDRNQVDAVNDSLDEILRRNGIPIERWYVCPHDLNDECRCMKPNPTFMLQAAGDYGLDLTKSFVIGDHPHDAATGETEGVFGLYLLTGHGIKHMAELPGERPVFHSLDAAARWIESHPDPRADLQRSIREGADALKSGGLVAFPTETVYGLGADALNPKAVARIFEAKNRPLYDPLIVHISEIRQVEALVTGVPETARRLMERFWPGPLTLVMPKTGEVPDIVTAGNSTVAVRMSSNPWAEALLRRARCPVAAPSANLFGRTSSTTADHVREQLDGSYDVLIDGGACRIGIESTVLSLVGPEPVILRRGGLTGEQIEEVTGPVRDMTFQNSGPGDSPGMLARHYAPVTPFSVVEDMKPFFDQPDVGKLIFSGDTFVLEGPCEVLSPAGDIREAAVNLYRAIRHLDGLGLRRIVAGRVPDEGLGKAVNDRLGKAAAGSGPD